MSRALCRPDHAYMEFLGKHRSKDNSLAGPRILTLLGYRLLTKTRRGHLTMSTCPEELFDDIQEKLGKAQKVMKAYAERAPESSMTDITEAAMGFLQTCVRAVVEQADGTGQSLRDVRLVVDQFHLVPLRGTTLLEPPFQLVQQLKQENIAVKVLLVERRAPDPKGKGR